MQPKIDYSEVNKYLLQLLPKREKSHILEQAEASLIPIVSMPVENLLRLFLQISPAKNILEIGTAIGYSAKIIREACPNAKIITIENDSEKYELAKENLKSDDINLIHGDALEIVPELAEQFDFIFLDFAKSLYVKILPFIIEKLSNGGILFCDNVLAHGQVAKQGNIPHKHRTQVKNLQLFLKDISENKLLRTSIIPIDDGVSISIKNL